MCPLARALDVLGERWTMLVVRELLLGPKRYKDLLAVLPAMGTNRLGERLASLSTDGVVRKVILSAPAAVPVYELTEYGEQLRQPLCALSRWGLNLPTDNRVDPQSGRGELIALGLADAAAPAASAGIQETYEFRVSGEVFHFLVNDGKILPRSGAAPAGVDLVVECNLGTFTALALCEITPTQARRQGLATVLTGTASLFSRAFAILGYRGEAPTIREDLRRSRA